VPHPRRLLPARGRPAARPARGVDEQPEGSAAAPGHETRLSARTALLSPAATRAQIARVLAQPSIALARAPAALAALTSREREILTLVASGLSNDDIAERLVISPATAKTHVNRTMMKLNARDRAQLVVIAYETGLITPGRNPD
jgi:DNA-binding NarL/FixJ family response regulator